MDNRAGSKDGSYGSGSGGGLSRCDGLISDCIIRGNFSGVGGGLYSCNGLKESCTVEGNHAGSSGGGFGACSGIISVCMISGNSSRDGAGRSKCGNVHEYCLIERCIISNNTSSRNGGGMSICNATIRNCVIKGNIADWSGGGLYSCEGSISNCVVSGNSSERGGGFYNFEGPVTNCTIVGNMAEEGGGLYHYDGSVINCIFAGNMGHALSNSYGWGSSLVIYSLFYDNPDGDWGYWVESLEEFYSANGAEEINSMPGAIGNIDSDPCFVVPGYLDSNETPDDVYDDLWIDGDYHLLGDSSAIDSGDPNYVPGANETDLDGNRRLIGSAIDMGAYEYVPPPIECEMWLTPRSLNLGSKGRWIKSHIVLPEGYVVGDVDVNRPCELVELDVESEDVLVFVNDEGLVEVEVTFARSAFCSSGYFEGVVTVVGSLIDGNQFVGTDMIRVNDRSFERLADLADYWLAIDCDGPDWCGGLDSNEDGVVNFGDFALLGGCCIEVLGR